MLRGGSETDHDIVQALIGDICDHKEFPSLPFSPFCHSFHENNTDSHVIQIKDGYYDLLK